MKRQKEEMKPKIQSLLFEALDADRINYLEWSNDAKAYLAAEDLDGTVKEETTATTTAASKWKALLMMRRHLDYSLKKQYLQIDTPHDVWRQLKKRFLHEKTIYLPQARSDWLQLHIMDFLDFMTFNAEIHRIIAELCLCGETIEEKELIDKTLSTFALLLLYLLKNIGT